MRRGTGRKLCNKACITQTANYTFNTTLPQPYLCCRNVGEAADAELMQGGQKLRRSRDAKVYIEYLLISRLVITVSFLPLVWNDLQSSAIAQAAQIGR